MATSWRFAAQGVATVLFLCINAGALHVAGYTRPPPGEILAFTASKKPAGVPQQVHVSAVGENYMKVSYVVPADTSSKSVPSLVEYGRESGKYTAKSGSTGAQSSSYRYFLYNSGEIHHVTIGPLEPDTVYYYRCGGAGNEYSLKTAPANLPVEFAVVGDLGQTTWTASTLEHIAGSDYDMLLLPGDLSYADTQQPLWDSFGLLVEPYASRRPWMVGAGNHEIESFPVVGPKPFIAYNARWLMPFENSRSPSNLYYSFDAAGGSVHVVVLCSYAEFDAESPQYRWLAGDLSAIDRKKTPWVFVLLHAPWYNTNTAHQGEGEAMRLAMEPLLFSARVDVVFAGHVHAYERFTRVYDNEANACGPVHITIGDGGNREGLALKFNSKSTQAPLSEFREASFGHGRLRVLNGTSAHWSWHRNDDAIDTVGDELWLESQASSSKACMATSQAKDEL